MKGGYYVQWTDSKGVEHTGIVRHTDQSPMFKGKLFIRETDDRFQEKSDNTGKLITLKFPKDVKQIGFFD